jgi:hypothetical protein
MFDNLKQYFFYIYTYVKNFLKIIKNLIINIIDNLILFDLKFIIDNLKDIIINNKKYLLLIIILIPFVFIIIIIMLLIGLINYILYSFFYIMYVYKIQIKKNKKNKKILKYKNDNINFKNPYNILIKKYILEKPKKIAFYTFYNSLYIILNLRNKKINKNFEFINLIFILIYNIIIRILFIIITGTPLIVIKAVVYLTIKTKNIEDVKFENLNTKIKFILFNCLIDLANEIELKIKNMKIIITKKKTIFNSKDTLKNFWIDFLSKVKNISQFKNATAQLEMNVYLDNIRNIKNDKKIYKKLEYKDKFLKENLVTTKPHLSLFLKIPNTNNLIYINETSKNELVIWNDNLKSIKNIELFFWHQGSINKKKETFLTPAILTENKKIIIENNINNMIKNTDKLQNIKSGMTANLLLNVNNILLETNFVEEQNKDMIIINKNNNTLINKMKEIEIENKNNKDIEKILDAFKITEEFLKNNEEIINEIPVEMRISFIQLCLNNYYNEKSDLFKEIITKIYFNK